MANSITLFKAYLGMIDEVYKYASLTSILDGDNTMVQQGANAGELIVPKMSMDGLADYSRSTGYVSGSVTLTNETIKADYDRGRKLSVDAMDNIETAGVAFGKLAAEFIRTKVVPELDAWRMAKYAGITGITSKSEALASGTDALAALITAQNSMDENEVPVNDRILFITPTLYNAVANVDTTKSKAVLDSFAAVQKIPQSRFVSAIELYDGTSEGETGGYYKKATAGKNLNFMAISKSAAFQYQKHTVNKVFSPEENQNADAWIFCYRTLGLATAYANKVKGIYASISTT